MIKKLLYFSVLCLLGVAASGVARADSLTYSSGTFCGPGPGCTTQVAGSDGAASASGTATFSINASGQLVVVLTDTTVNPWQDSQNLAAISFLLNNGTAITQSQTSLTSISGNDIASTPVNTNLTSLIAAGTGQASKTTTPWKPTASGNSMNTGGNFISYDAVAPAGPPPNQPGPGSIAGAPTLVGGLPEYTTAGQTCSGPDPGGNCGSSLGYGNNAVDDPMIYQTATFVFNISGTTIQYLQNCTTGSSSHTCVSNVQFGFGPDDLDPDDVTAGTLTADVPSVSITPEPSSLLLLGTGMTCLAGVLRKRTSA